MNAPLTEQFDRGTTELGLTRLVLGGMDNNCYLLRAPGGEMLLIDAAAEPDRLLAALREASVDQVPTVVITHRHHDHLGALSAVQQATGSQVLAGADDAEAIAAATGTQVSPVRGGDSISVGDAALEVIELRGHTPGSIALLWQPQSGPARVFTGDSLFPGGVGKTGSAQDFTSLLDDVSARLFDRLGDDTIVHPGHGDPTTLGRERGELEAWRARGW